MTGSMLYANLKRDLGLRAADMWAQSQVLSTGHRIQRPSDDPVAANKALGLRRCLVEADQYLKTVDDAAGWLDTADVALDCLTQDLQRARDLTVLGASEALPAASRDAMAREVDQLLNHAVQVGNSCYGSRFIFGGTRTSSPPFALLPPDTVVYNGDAGEQWREIAQSVQVRVSLAGDQVVLPACQALAQVARDLRNGDAGNLAGPTLQQLDAALDRVMADRTEVGARANRLELGKNRLLDLQLNLQKQLSLAEDADMAEAMVEYSRRQSAYEAALSVAGRLLECARLNLLR